MTTTERLNKIEVEHASLKAQVIELDKNRTIQEVDNKKTLEAIVEIKTMLTEHKEEHNKNDKRKNAAVLVAVGLFSGAGITIFNLIREALTKGPTP